MSEFKKGDIVFSHNKKYKGKAWYWVRSSNAELIFPSFVVSWIYDVNSMVVNYKPDPSLPYFIDSGEMRKINEKDKRKLIKAILDIAHLEVKKKT
jgi:hypothetical protein